MSYIAGPVRQIAFVVPDLDAAVAYWTQTLRIGTFFVLREVRPDDFSYRGAPSPSPLTSIALGNSGDLQVEIIEQRDDAPSVYRDSLDAGREGMQHISAWGDARRIRRHRRTEKKSGSGMAEIPCAPSFDQRRDETAGSDRGDHSGIKA